MTDKRCCSGAMGSLTCGRLWNTGNRVFAASVGLDIIIVCHSEAERGREGERYCSYGIRTRDHSICLVQLLGFVCLAVVVLFLFVCFFLFGWLVGWLVVGFLFVCFVLFHF